MEMKFGNYRDNKNYKVYAQFLQDQLLLIDPEIFLNDNCYFWGSLVEDIYNGIVG
jgi:hypothetical protein